ncbi:MAG: Fe-S cluster assembly ATP-binding protein [Acidobacteriota bacterium]|jgi:Fe-S cluster assembly ATP-binding protein|nr:Fe-S cluster assembly ATP-binding protein [Acidobacteriota bacterium]
MKDRAAEGPEILRFAQDELKEMALLEIKDLHAGIDGKEILRGLDLSVDAGEVHAIMGPNGSGKSTLANVLAGRPRYEVTRGSVVYDGKNLLELPAEERAREGVFLAMQYPVEIPGVNNIYFLKAALNAMKKHRGEEELDAMEFLQLAREKMKLVELDEKFMNRSVNEGFSGGEKKRNEIFQMAVLDPKLAILDETDSGLDIDALRIVAEGVNALKNEKHAVLVITHYQRLLTYLVPDYVHVLSGGRIVKSGGKELALELEAKGYDWIEDEVAVAR